MTAARDGELGEVAGLFLELGVVGSGDRPPTSLLMREEVVQRRHWVDEREFLDLLGDTNIIPGGNLLRRPGHPMAGCPAMSHRTAEELTAGLDEIARSPVGSGTLEMIVRRPDVGEREVIDTADLDLELGLVGDSWSTRGGGGAPDRQLTLMNARAAALVAADRERWPLAGDQLYVDLHLGGVELPPGTRVAIGDTALIEVTAAPHTGCAKFSARFGVEALRVVNSESGRALNLRGINARVVAPGTIRCGDTVGVVAT